MLQLPDFAKTMEYENNFYLSCQNTRLAKLIAHYELFKMIEQVPGAIVECGVFKGASFSRFAAFRELFSSDSARKLVGFDIFGKFPETKFGDDVERRKDFIDVAGEESVSVGQLVEVLRNKRSELNVELIAGDITRTIPEYRAKHPEFKIALLNLDTDIYEPAVTILEYLYPCLAKGGVLILDDYGVFPGETKAVDDYFFGKNVTIRKFPFSATPCFVIKE